MQDKEPQSWFLWIGILTVFFFAVLYLGGLNSFADLNYCVGEVPVGGDFWQYWAGARLVLEGHGAGVYDTAALSHSMAAVSDVREKYSPLFYPPPFLFLIAPFGFLPYFTGLLCFFGAGLALLALALWLWVRNPAICFALLGLGAVWHNFPTGQNGLITAGLAGIAFWALERRPFLSGALIGLLTIKPHLGLLWPIMLVAERRWKVLLTATAVGCALALAAAAAFGIEAWIGFFKNLGLAKLTIEHRWELWKHTASLYSFLRSCGLSDSPAFAAQLLLSATVLTLAPFSLKKLSDPVARLAFFATVTLMAAPFVYNYDLAWLVWPVLYLLTRPIKGPWRWVEIFYLAFAYFYPGLSIPLNKWAPISFGFPLVAGLYFLQLRRIQTLPQGPPSR